MNQVGPLIPALRRYARSLLKERTAADDLVQDCLEHAIAAWDRRRRDGDARTWVFTILHNLAINQLKQAKRRGVHVSIDAMVESAVPQGTPQEDSLRHAELLMALDRLPEEQRSVLLLVSVEDLTYAETAKVLDVPLGTVMSRLSRAREKLKRLMDEGVDGPSTPFLRRVK